MEKKLIVAALVQGIKKWSRVVRVVREFHDERSCSCVCVTVQQHQLLRRQPPTLPRKDFHDDLRLPKPKFHLPHFRVNFGVREEHGKLKWNMIGMQYIIETWVRWCKLKCANHLHLHLLLEALNPSPSPSLIPQVLNFIIFSFRVIKILVLRNQILEGYKSNYQLWNTILSQYRGSPFDYTPWLHLLYLCI